MKKKLLAGIVLGIIISFQCEGVEIIQEENERNLLPSLLTSSPDTKIDSQFAELDPEMIMNQVWTHVVDTTMQDTLFSAFLEDSPENLSKLEKAISEKDCKAAALMAGKLKEDATYFIEELSAVAAKIEEMANLRNLSEAGALFKPFKKQYEALITIIKSWQNLVN